MNEHPILFQGWKINKILNRDWSKGNMQTRRVIKPQPPKDYAKLIGPVMYAPTVIDRWGMEQPGQEIFGVYTEDGEWGWKCKYGKPGDHLWCKETHRWADRLLDGYERDDTDYVQYKADGFVMQRLANQVVEMEYDYGKDWSIDSKFGKWRSSIFMPRWASRITLEIVGIRVERVQEISEEDARMEGIDPTPPKTWIYASNCRRQFMQVWNKINGHPKPVIVNKEIVSYEAFPWDLEYTANYPGVEKIGQGYSYSYRGKSLYIYPNSWVFVIEYRRILS